MKKMKHSSLKQKGGFRNIAFFHLDQAIEKPLEQELHVYSVILSHAYTAHNDQRSVRMTADPQQKRVSLSTPSTFISLVSLPRH